MNEGIAAHQAHPRQEKRVHDLGFYTLFGVVLLIPLFFVPSNMVSLQFSKVLAVALLTVVALGFSFLRSLKGGTFSYQWSMVHISIWFLVLAYLVASFFSSQPVLSFLGYEADTDTFGFIVLATALAHITALTVTSKAKIFSLFIALLFAAWGVFIFQFVQVVFGAPFPFLSDPSANLVGRWNDFGIFAGLVASLILFALELLPFSKRHYGILGITFFVSLIAMMFVQLDGVWAVFGLASFIALVLGLSRRFMLKGEKPEILLSGVLPALGLVVAIFFLFTGGGVSSFLQQKVSISTLEVRPSLQSTINVLNGVYAHDPIFGSGPNTFNSQWLLYRPGDIVQTPFWNVSFDSGANTILSSIATGGIAIALGWLFLILALLYTVVRALFIEEKESQSSLVVLMTALAVSYLLAVHLITTPNQSITLLLFLFIGLFMASLAGTPLVRTIRIPLNQSPRVAFAFVLGGIALILLALGFVYEVGKSYASAYYHNTAISVANQSDLDGALRALKTAINLDIEDRYYRTATLINLAQLNRIVQSGNNDADAQAAFQSALASAVQNASAAVQKDPLNFSNVMSRAFVFGNVVPLRIDGALENATAAYAQARALNPSDPEVEYRLAQLSFGDNNNESARQFIQSALSKKADYTDAILLLAQIEVNEGNLAKAVESVRNAVFFEPQNSVLLYQLGILLLQNESYSDAASAFEATLRLNPQFSNASFFLTQAYAFLGRFDEAKTIMVRLAEENPDNALVKEYRDTLESGENPFKSAPVPAPSDEEVIE